MTLKISEIKGYSYVVTKYTKSALGPIEFLGNTTWITGRRDLLIFHPIFVMRSNDDNHN